MPINRSAMDIADLYVLYFFHLQIGNSRNRGLEMLLIKCDANTRRCWSKDAPVVIRLRGACKAEREHRLELAFFPV